MCESHTGNALSLASTSLSTSLINSTSSSGFNIFSISWKPQRRRLPMKKVAPMIILKWLTDNWWNQQVKIILGQLLLSLSLLKVEIKNKFLDRSNNYGRKFTFTFTVHVKSWNQVQYSWWIQKNRVVNLWHYYSAIGLFQLKAPKRVPLSSQIIWIGF